MFLPNHFRSNPFEKHIYKLQELISLIEDHKSVGGIVLNLEITEREKEFLQEALNSLNIAVKCLKKLDSYKQLLR